MSSDLSISIDPEKLAISGELLSGTINLSDLHRLTEYIGNESGEASYKLAFSRNEKGIITITGDIQADVILVCQRCLNDMRIPIKSDVSIGIVYEESELDVLDEGLDPFLAEQGKISVLTLIEEDILLGLPISPMHDKADCPATEPLQEYTTVKQNPFTVLESLKRGKT